LPLDQTAIDVEDGPTPERRRHGHISRDSEQCLDTLGRISWPHRARDTLGELLDNGWITRDQHASGAEFRQHFRAAHLDDLRAQDLARVRVDGAIRPSASGNSNARKAVHDALDQLGAPGDSAIWHVVGLEQSLSEWRQTYNWNGRAIDHHTARGILVQALATLAEHFYGRR
jgi:hypothetical protein